MVQTVAGFVPPLGFRPGKAYLDFASKKSRLPDQRRKLPALARQSPRHDAPENQRPTTLIPAGAPEFRSA